MDRVSKAKIQLLMNNPFFGYLGSSLESKENESLDGTGPMGTDGKYLYYNKKELDKFLDAELEACIAHEVMHCALGHIWRREKRHLKAWNLATDAVINTELEDCGFKLPNGAFMGETDWRHLSAEEIYEKIINSERRKYYAGIWGKVNIGDHKTWEKANSSNEEKKQEKWKRRVINAERISRDSHGNLPASLNRMIQDLKQPKLPWNILLRRYIRRHEKFDYSWRKLNKRLQPFDIIYPGIIGKELKIAVCVDTSGSITREQLERFMSEMRGILKAVKKVEILFYICDVGIKEGFPKKISDVADLKSSLVDLRGGGGTSFKPVFQDEELKEYQVLVYLTDCMGTYPDEEPDMNVIWVCNQKEEQLHDYYKPPFGQFIELM